LSTEKERLLEQIQSLAAEREGLLERIGELEARQAAEKAASRAMIDPREDWSKAKNESKKHPARSASEAPKRRSPFRFSPSTAI